jgi:hypothetical protein
MLGIAVAIAFVAFNIRYKSIPFRLTWQGIRPGAWMPTRLRRN